MAALDQYELRQKQRKFCDIYLITGNATQAAIAAGYSVKNAKCNASRMLTYANVSAYLRLKREEYNKNVGVRVEAKLKYLWLLVNQSMGDDAIRRRTFKPMAVIAAMLN